jgi:MraZ protein
MGIFRGVFSVKIDSKFRMNVPVRYRGDHGGLGHGVVVTIDAVDRCLLLYPLSAWEEVEKHIEALPSFNKATRRVKRLLIGHAHDLEMDRQGRILLPSSLREYAELGSQVVLVGQGKKFEIWSQERWESQRQQWLGEIGQDDQITSADLDDLPL